MRDDKPDGDAHSRRDREEEQEHDDEADPYYALGPSKAGASCGAFFRRAKLHLDTRGLWFV